MLHTDAQIAELDAALLALPPESDGMLASEFDGFVTGLLLCPEMIFPSEWLPRVWGDPELAVFEGDAAAQRTVAAVMAHYNRVARGLARNRPVCEPLFERTGEALWELWVAGFEEAMRLRPDSWTAALESGDPDVEHALPLLLTLHAIQAGESDMPKDSIKELTEQAPDLIPTIVLTLNAWVKTQRGMTGAADLPGAPARRAKVGRNDPCPCGSERKFKKCCGQGTVH
jgi:uncharacterized protein